MCDKKSIRELYNEKKGSGMSYSALFLAEKVEKKIEKHSTGTEFQEDYLR